MRTADEFKFAGGRDEGDENPPQSNTETIQIEQPTVEIVTDDQEC